VHEVCDINYIMSGHFKKLIIEKVLMSKMFVISRGTTLVNFTKPIT